MFIIFPDPQPLPLTPRNHYLSLPFSRNLDVHSSSPVRYWNPTLHKRDFRYGRKQANTPERRCTSGLCSEMRSTEEWEAEKLRCGFVHKVGDQHTSTEPTQRQRKYFFLPSFRRREPRNKGKLWLRCTTFRFVVCGEHGISLFSRQTLAKIYLELCG